jgi:hypothetical protein
MAAAVIVSPLRASDRKHRRIRAGSPDAAHRPEVRTHYEHGGPERILDLTLRTGPFGDRYGENPDGLTLDKLKAHPNGVNFGQMVPRVPEVLGTTDRKIRLAPQYLLDDLPRLARRLDRAPDELVLVRPSPSAVQQLVPAQCPAADEGRGALHPADAPRRRRQAGHHDG